MPNVTMIFISCPGYRALRFIRSRGLAGLRWDMACVSSLVSTIYYPSITVPHPSQSQDSQLFFQARIAPVTFSALFYFQPKSNAMATHPTHGPTDVTEASLFLLLGLGLPLSFLPPFRSFIPRPRRQRRSRSLVLFLNSFPPN